MPAAIEEKPITEEALRQIVAWAVKYLIDPKRGAGKNLPSLKEIKATFPNTQIPSIEIVENWIYNLFNSTDLEKIAQDQQKVDEVLKETEGKEKEKTINEAAVPLTHLPPAPTTTSQGRVSALGILAEIDTVLENHKNSISPKLTSDLSPKIKELLPKLGIKNLSEEQLNKISQEVASETSRQTLDEASKIQNVDQINDLVADSLTQTLITHPEIANQLKEDPSKIFEKVAGQTKEVTSANQDNLEKAAVLANLENISRLKKPTEEVAQIVADSARDAVESQTPLAEPALNETLKGNLKTYLSEYVDQINEELSSLPKDQIPTLKQLQDVKNTAHSSATAKTGTNLGSKIGYQNVTGNLARSMGLAQSSQTNAPKLPFVMQTIVNNPKYGQELYLAALGHDEETLAKNLKKNSEIIEILKKKRSLSFKEAKQFSEAKLYWAKYAQAQALKIKKPKRYQALLKVLSQIGNGRAEVTSQSVWQSERFLQTKMPKIFAYNERLAAGAAFGSLGFNFSGFSPGSIFSNIASSWNSVKSIGMGTKAASIAGTNPLTGYAMEIGRKLRNVSGAVFGGLALYFLQLGQAAFIGFVTGATIGATAGLAAGIGVTIALGPIGILAAPVIIPIAMFTGGIAGGVAGGLIGWGMASGSVGAIGTGVGAGIGATAGGIIGGTIGFGIGGPIGAFIGATLGTYIGGLLGAAAGYLVGTYFISPAISAFNSAISGIGGISVGGGIVSSIGSLLTGLASAAWGGITSIAGGAFSLVSSGLGTLVSSGFGLFGASTASAAALPVFVGVGMTATTGAIAAIIVPAAIFSSIATEENPNVTPGQNEFFTLTKTADKQHLENSPTPQDATFTVVLTAKDKNLSQVTITDNYTTKTSSNNPITVTCPTDIAAQGNCTQSFTITVDSTLNDSLIPNTATAKATPEGGSEKTESVTTTVSIGTPPADCPNGWPTLGDVTQGPEGATSHSDNPLIPPGGYEALDIGQGTSFGGNPQDVKSTVEGIVIRSEPRDDPLNQRIVIQPLSCSGLSRIYFVHLSRRDVNENDTVHLGQTIGKTGAPLGTDGVRQPHLHYQFNDDRIRTFKIESPYVPVTVPRTCDGVPACNAKADRTP